MSKCLVRRSLFDGPEVQVLFEQRAEVVELELLAHLGLPAVAQRVHEQPEERGEHLNVEEGVRCPLEGEPVLLGSGRRVVRRREGVQD